MALNKRFVILDFYRYLAAVGVVLFHADAISVGTVDILNLDGMFLFVDFFFVLSGFVLTHTYAGAKLTVAGYQGFMLKRLARVYPLHLFTMLFYVITAIALPRMTMGYELADLLANLSLTHAWGVLDHTSLNGPSWSISAEFFCYLIFPLLMPLVQRVPGAITLLLAALLYLVLSEPWAFWDNDGMFGAYYDFGALRALPSFVLGCGVYRLYQTVPRLPHAALRMWAGGAVFLAASAFMVVDQSPYIVLATYALSILVTATGERDGTVNRRLAGFFEWVGDSSYALYLIHYRLLALVAAPLWALFKLPMTFMPVWLLATVATCTLLARAVFLYVEVPAKELVLAMSRRVHTTTAAPASYHGEREPRPAGGALD